MGAELASILPVILCGGMGTRLAPLSTPEKPKQFHCLSGGARSLFQETLLRAASPLYADALIFGNHAHESLINSQLLEIDIAPQALFLEPLSRNTAAPVILSALYASGAGYQHILALPSDHAIENSDAFNDDIQKAAGNNGPITYFGIVPTASDAAYGYIQEGICFHEKPDETRAADLIARGALWNSGIFLINVPAFLEDLNAVNTGLLQILSVIDLGKHLSIADYEEVPSVPFDKAYCEKSAKGTLMKASFDWSDLGSWESLAQKRAAA